MLAPPITSLNLALVGTPNSGKTSLFNALTGSRQRAANYPGVTVERKSGMIQTPGGRAVTVLDLPGTYSLRGRSPDEEITREVVFGEIADEKIPDCIVCVADATNLRLSFRLLLELKQVGRPMLLVLNMIDLARHRGIVFDLDRLSSELGIPVVTAVSVRKGGTADLLRHLDGLIPTDAAPNIWQPHSPTALRALQREADRIIAATVTPPAKPDTATNRIDAVVLHPVAGLLILLTVLFVMFQAVFSWAQPAMDLLTNSFAALGQLVHATLPDGLLQSFLQNGVISGVGSVVVFLPQILILFLFILLLEDFGYMARAAFLMDRIMGGAGLHGRAFIPLLSSFACAIPGIMAARVIDNKRDRLTTILIAPLMTCSARLPVYALLIGAFIPMHHVLGIFNLQGLVLFALYAAGILGAMAVGWVIKRIHRDKSEHALLMELPSYRMPKPRDIAIGLWERSAIFIKRLTGVILALTVLMWFISTFPSPPAGATGPAIDYSFAGYIGHGLQFIFAPLGFNWQISLSLIPAFAARETAVAALATVYAVGGDANTGGLAHALATNFSLASALSLLVWFAFAPQCMSTLAVIRRETNSWRNVVISFSYMFAVAYVASLLTYQITRLLT